MADEGLAPAFSGNLALYPLSAGLARGTALPRCFAVASSLQTARADLAKASQAKTTNNE
jgi:hypothetical protein